MNWIDKLFKKKLAVEDKENTLVIPQFDSAQCVANGLDNGETFATTDLADGVQGVVCMLPPKEEGGEGSVEVQSLVFSKDSFDAESATAWAQGNDFKASSKARREHLSFRASHPLKRYPGALLDFKRLMEEQGAPPSEIKDSESVTSIEDKIMGQFRARGWAMDFTVQDQKLEYDFMIEAHFPEQKSVIVCDFITGEYYTVSYSGEGDSITIGDPQKTDLVFEPAGAVSGETSCASVHASLGNSIQKPPATSTDPNAYPLLVMSSGWTADAPSENHPKRYISKAAIQDAFERKLLSNLNCYWQHPTPNDITDEARPNVPFGYAVPGSERLKENIAGGLDLYIDVVTFDNTPGRDIKPLLQRSKDTGTPQTRNSLVFDVERTFEDVDGRPAEVYQKFATIYAIDFMDNAAMPRTGVRAAASRSTTEGELSMGDKEELARLRAKETADAETVKKAALVVRESEVDTLIAASGVPKDDFSALRPILIGIEDENTRKALVENHRLAYTRNLKPTPGGKQGDGANDDPIAELSPAMQTEVGKVMARQNLTPEKLKAARAAVLARKAA